jgi:phosphoserine phosphatase
LSRFNSVTIDVDSTLCGIEGIDWLAERRGVEVAGKIRELTAGAMDGAIPLEAVYAERLALVAPSREEVAALAQAYLERIADGAPAAIRAMLASGVDVHLISGGLLQAVSHVAERIPLPMEKVHAVAVHFNGDGSYAGFDSSSPLTTDRGKGEILAGLSLPRPALMVGDGMTDAEARPAVDAFAAFTGFVSREPVIERADHLVSNFHELLELVMR